MLNIEVATPGVKTTAKSTTINDSGKNKKQQQHHQDDPPVLDDIVDVRHQLLQLLEAVVHL